MPSFFDIINEPPVPLGEPYPLFNRVSIETTSHCNRRCPFCPIADGRRDFKISMDDRLYASVVDQLGETSFDGVVQAFLLNEPTLDPKLHERLRYARQHIPLACIYISTNGDTLTYQLGRAVETLLSLYAAGCTVVNLNVYDVGNDGLAQLEHFTKVVDELWVHGIMLTEHKYRRHASGKRYVALTDMRPERLETDVSLTDSFHTRGVNDTDAHVKFNKKTAATGKQRRPPTYCARTQRHLVVRYDGKVPVCCAVDPTDPNVPVVGDLNTQTLLQVWNSEAMYRYRWFTQQGLRVLPGCAGCVHRMAYPHVVRKVMADDATVERWKREVLA